ncbi:hypothetical protein BRM1_00705 [Brevibacterium sp. BRM-1]|uniref:hypothetical protein n=1 Tax=Brevibacterium sp. BRM-1 TaxID=2999062 RepID=UPI00227E64D2|nr:hypothetical protein [Brevibacterium sp. BRM-1]WAL40433.1 hypothetical protein BRM1_00705 [Brevibacterium sp. BRM-1]
MKKLFLLPVSAGAALALALTGVQPVQASVGAAPQSQPAAIARAAAVGSHSTTAQAPAAAHAQAAKRSARPKLTVVSKHITVSSATKRGVVVRGSHFRPGQKIAFASWLDGWDGAVSVSKKLRADRHGNATGRLRAHNGWLDAKRFEAGRHELMYGTWDGGLEDSPTYFTVHPNLVAARHRVSVRTLAKKGDRLTAIGGEPRTMATFTLRNGKRTLVKKVRVGRNGKAVWVAKKTGALKKAHAGTYRATVRVTVIGGAKMSAATTVRVTR